MATIIAVVAALSAGFLFAVGSLVQQGVARQSGDHDCRPEPSPGTPARQPLGSEDCQRAEPRDADDRGPLQLPLHGEEPRVHRRRRVARRPAAGHRGRHPAFARTSRADLLLPADAAALACAGEFCAQIDKTAVQIQDLPGYVVNRLLVPYMLHAIETPEHDKLWFDEKPPKKFDF